MSKPEFYGANPYYYNPNPSVLSYPPEKQQYPPVDPEIRPKPQNLSNTTFERNAFTSGCLGACFLVTDKHVSQPSSQKVHVPAEIPDLFSSANVSRLAAAGAAYHTALEGYIPFDHTEIVIYPNDTLYVESVLPNRTFCFGSNITRDPPLWGRFPVACIVYDPTMEMLGDAAKNGLIVRDGNVHLEKIRLSSKPREQVVFTNYNKKPGPPRIKLGKTLQSSYVPQFSAPDRPSLPQLPISPISPPTLPEEEPETPPPIPEPTPMEDIQPIPPPPAPKVESIPSPTTPTQLKKPPQQPPTLGKVKLVSFANAKPSKSSMGGPGSVILANLNKKAPPRKSKATSIDMSAARASRGVARYQSGLAKRNTISALSGKFERNYGADKIRKEMEKRRSNYGSFTEIPLSDNVIIDAEEPVDAAPATVPVPVKVPESDVKITLSEPISPIEDLKETYLKPKFKKEKFEEEKEKLIPKGVDLEKGPEFIFNETSIVNSNQPFLKRTIFGVRVYIWILIIIFTAICTGVAIAFLVSNGASTGSGSAGTSNTGGKMAVGTTKSSVAEVSRYGFNSYSVNPGISAKLYGVDV